MSHYDQSWNYESNIDFRGPRNVHERPPLNEQHGNLQMQNPRFPQMGPSPRDQFHNYPSMSGTTFNNAGNHLHMPQHLQYQNHSSQFQMQRLPPLPQTPRQQSLQLPQPSLQRLPPPSQLPVQQPLLPPQPPQQRLPQPSQLPMQQPSLPPQSSVQRLPPPLQHPVQQQPPLQYPVQQPSLLQHQVQQAPRLQPPMQQPPPPQFLEQRMPRPFLPSMQQPLLSPQAPLQQPMSSQPLMQPPPLRPPSMVAHNSSSNQRFSIPPPSQTMMGQGQIVSRPQLIGNAQPTPADLMMNCHPSQIPLHSSFQQMSNCQPFPQNPTQSVPLGYLQHTAVISTIQHEGIHNQQISITGNKCASDGKELGQQKLENWLQKIGKSKKLQSKGLSKHKSSEQIWKSMNQFRAMTKLISTMSSKLHELSDSASSANTAEWKSMTMELETLKNQYTDLESLLDDNSVQRLEKKLNQQQKKRTRLRKARERKYEEQQRLEELWAEKSQQIDKWQERHRAKIKEENLRKSRKATADRTLSKVTREIQDATRLIETMMALQKLRLIRRDAAEKRGDTDLGESRHTFEQKIADMTRLIQAQLECYKEEEAKLKQIIKSEQEEDTKKDRLAQIEKEKQREKEEYEDIQSMLFGQQEEVTNSDPLFPYVQYYRQAESNLQTFLQIRNEWDSFLAVENNPTSSVIPSSWVFPEFPSSVTWATALK